MIIIITVFMFNIPEISIGELYRGSEFGSSTKIRLAFRRKLNTEEIILYNGYYEKHCIKQ